MKTLETTVTLGDSLTLLLLKGEEDTYLANLPISITLRSTSRGEQNQIYSPRMPKVNIFVCVSLRRCFFFIHSHLASKTHSPQPTWLATGQPMSEMWMPICKARLPCIFRKKKLSILILKLPTRKKHDDLCQIGHCLMLEYQNMVVACWAIATLILVGQ